MSLKSLAPILALIIGTAGTLAVLADTPRPPASRPANAPAEGGGEARGGPGGRGARGAAIPANLSGAMSEMQRAYDALKREATDPARIEQTLRDIAILQRDTITSKINLAPMINRMNGDEKTKAIANYRAMYNSLMRTLLDLEDAVNDKKTDEIKKHMAEIEQSLKDGHAEFRPGRGD